MTQTIRGELRRAVYAHVQNNPGCTAADMATHFPDKAGSAASTLSNLHHDGLLSRQKVGSHYYYIIAEKRDAPTPSEAQLAATAKVARRLAEVEAQLAKTRAQLSETEDKLSEVEAELEETDGYAARLKVTAQTELVNTQQQVVTVLAQIDGLSAQIAELQAWKATAIEKHPDLAEADPLLLLKAREIVAGVLRDRGAPQETLDRLLGGQMDDVPSMQAALLALQSAQQ
jgi:vacuolar-type H+-ATPase subunit I/STV1